MSFTAADMERWHRELARASGTLSLAIVRRRIQPGTLSALAETARKVAEDIEGKTAEQGKLF
jgi:hypothetical protein